MTPILLLGIGLFTGCVDVPPFAGESSGVRVGASDPDVCSEHGVLDAVCTQCNTALIPVFQAKGDWCEEHGFPESFCPICRPEQEGRPTEADLSMDESPPDGTKVRFKTREAADLAGIQTEPATEASWTGGTEAVARLAWDATRVAMVSARSPGIVMSIEADVGSQVAPGTSLARLRSAHVGGDRSRVSAARRGVAVAQAEVGRKRELLEVGVTSEREVLAAEQALALAEAELGGLEAELGLVGAGSGDAYAVTSPIAGVVTERTTTIGQAVEPRDPLFQVVDPTRMWAELSVSEADLDVVAVGQSVQLVLDALPERRFEGTIDYLAPSVDPQTRTTLARVVLDNPDGALRANTYGTAHIVTDTAQAVVTVPSAAVQRAGEVHLVFVREADDSFIARRVVVVARAGGRVRISGGVQPGDRVATTGSFLLKTETIRDSIGAGCCDVE